MSPQTGSSVQNSANRVSDETISINWCFLNSERPLFNPRPIHIPTRLYERPSQDCRELFCKALREEYEFIARRASITFWRPVTHLSDMATEEEWQQFLDASRRSRIPWTRPFRIMLDNLEIKYIVHLIVTADALEEREDELDAVPPLHKFDLTLKDARKRLYSKKKAVSPSEGAKPSTFAKMQLDENFYHYCGRPYSREYRVPLTLFDPVFAQFVDDCKTIEFTSKDMDFAFDLKIEMSGFFDSENTRRDRFNEMMKEIYAIELQEDYTIQGTDYNMDVCVSHNGRPILISEVKNEMAGLNSEPTLHASLCYMEAVEVLSEDVSSCHPCFTLILVGPFIGFGGCVLTDHVISQPFSILPLAFHTSDNDAFESLARHLAALKRAVNSLRGTYSQLPAVTPPAPKPVSRIFPYQRTSCILGTDNLIEFSYETERDDGRLIFDGQTAAGVPICIKFVRKYGQEAHELCAKNGFAPKLFGVEKLPGGWMMIIMERMDENWTRLLAFKEERNEKNKALDKDEKAVIETRISSCLELLHGAGMVHGDIRDVNILVKKDDLSQVRIVDFDWADKEGEARYPKFVNVAPDVGRPKEVEAFGIIKADHDNYMVPDLFDNLDVWDPVTPFEFEPQLKILKFELFAKLRLDLGIKMSAAGPPSPAQVDQIISDTQALAYVNVLVLALFVYDTLLTLDDEIQYIWKPRINPGTILYYLARYAGLLNTFLNVFFGFIPFNINDARVCETINSILNICFILGFVGTHGLLTARAYALYYSNMIVSVLLVGLMAGGLIPVLIQTITLSNCDLSPGQQILLSSHNPRLIDVRSIEVIFITVIECIVERKARQNTAAHSLSPSQTGSSTTSREQARIEPESAEHGTVTTFSQSSIQRAVQYIHNELVNEFGERPFDSNMVDPNRPNDVGMDNNPGGRSLMLEVDFGEFRWSNNGGRELFSFSNADVNDPGCNTS
ncbi:hypothetical protein Clacol_005187 [Clathrus columnatus]|uniref:Protein kinase domain-containing protein n=1 Tax=Clathrus columnatus TaxID=1419009 RepID=A0AAV5ACV0_9AGAM|nr:hypothetical protein Clacol_005187 [Clathrus columnatus]